MKKFIAKIALVAACVLPFTATAQNNKTIAPAIINIVNGSVHFVDTDGNGVLNAGEKGRVVFKVRNDGTGDGVGCRAVVTLTGTTDGITAQDKLLPTIPAGKEIEVDIPVSAGANTENGDFKVSFLVDEPNGFGSGKVTCDIPVQQKFRAVAIQPWSLKMVDNSGDGKLEGNEAGNIVFTVSNDGKTVASGYKVRVRTWGATDDIAVDDYTVIPDLPVGNSREIKIPVKAGLDTKVGTMKAALSVMDPSALFTDELTVEIPVAAYRHPKLEVVAASLSQSIARRAPFTLELTVKNTGAGPAKDISVDLSIPDNVFFTAGGSKQTVPALAPGESTVLKYNMIVNNDYVGNDISTWLNITENYGRGDNFVSVSMVVNGNTMPNVKNYCHRFVDLGLPGGVLWATCNVGASMPEDYGLYFAWGETVGYAKGESHTFDWAHYKWCNGSSYSMTKYCTSSSYGRVDNKTVLDAADDAATANWGDGWRMPTLQEMKDLVDDKYTTTEWVTVNGVSGRKITSKSNGNSIFLPAAGYRNDTSLGSEGSYGYYWSSSLNTVSSIYAYYLYFYSGRIVWYYGNRYRGQGVRAVRVPSE